MPRQDDAQAGWDNMLSQHHQSPLTEALVKSLLRPLAATCAAAEGLLQALDYANATGERLDYVGSIVGITREIPNGVFLSYFGFEGQPAATGFGQSRMRHQGDATSVSYMMPDIEYRSIIRTKIALNNGHGTSGEIRDALIDAFNTNNVSVRDSETAPATARAWIGRLASEAEVLSSVIPRLVPRLGGVKLEYLFYDADRVFDFLGKRGAAGFGKGIMHRTALTPITPF